MKSIAVESSKRYKILIGYGILNEAGRYIQDAAGGKTAMIVTDDIVDSLYGGKLSCSLLNSGYDVFKFVIKNGERSKNADNFISLLNCLAENKLTRNDLVIALGGGVVGDLAGFAAATYLRGIHFVQVPTTLLSAVDSSIGGKTGIDLDKGKNLAGAFYQPDLVLCDYSTLSTLEDDTFRDGCAEVIKYGIIADKELFDKLKDPIMPQLEEVIETCVNIKKDVVTKDEFDTGIRQILNFGHTIGHAVEVCSKYDISHGSAVAMGMSAMTKAAYKMNICNKSTCESVDSLLDMYGFDIDIPFGTDDLYSAITRDKKRTGNVINIIMPERIGRCIIKQFSMNELKELISSVIEK